MIVIHECIRRRYFDHGLFVIALPCPLVFPVKQYHEFILVGISCYTFSRNRTRISHDGRLAGAAFSVGAAFLLAGLLEFGVEACWLDRMAAARAAAARVVATTGAGLLSLLSLLLLLLSMRGIESRIRKNKKRDGVIRSASMRQNLKSLLLLLIDADQFVFCYRLLFFSTKDQTSCLEDT